MLIIKQHSQDKIDQTSYIKVKDYSLSVFSLSILSVQRFIRTWFSYSLLCRMAFVYFVWMSESQSGFLMTLRFFSLRLPWETASRLSVVFIHASACVWCEWTFDVFSTGTFPSLHIWVKSAEGRCWSESCTRVPHLGKTHMYPRGSYCHILHSIKLCESHFIWSCHGYSLDPAGPRSKEESSMCTWTRSQCEIFNGRLFDQIANQNLCKLLIWQWCPHRMVPILVSHSDNDSIYSLSHWQYSAWVYYRCLKSTLSWKC